MILVSILTFFLSKQVPVDQVDILLNIQGIDDSDVHWEKEYYALKKKMDLHLPEFYFSIQPNYLYKPRNEDSDIYEQKFIHTLSSQKYSKSFILQITTFINQADSNIRKQLYASTDLDQLYNKISTGQINLPPNLGSSLSDLIATKSSAKIKWHYPIIHFNGLQNQYHKWISKVIQGDFGVSLLDTRPITDKLWEAMNWSVLLVLLNLFFAILLAFPIGIYNGVHPNSLIDKISNSILFAFFAIPKFWMATLFIIFFTTSEYGEWTKIFPSVGFWYTDGDQGFLDMLANSWQKLILPVLILVVPDTAYLARLIRSSVREESNKEYIKTAFSKGLSKKEITIKHILPNSLIPTISLLVGTLPGALASALVIEVIFNIPGIGRLMYDSITLADWAMVYPIVLITSVLTVVAFLVGDILMAFLNPKINLG